MMKSAALLMSVAFCAVAQTPAPPPAIYKNGAELLALAKAQLAKNPEMGVAGVSTQGGYHINVVSRNKPGPAGSHATGPARGTEVHYIIEGAGTIVTGGTIVRPPGGGRGAGSSIEGGVVQHVVKGDVVVIPANTPHWYKEVEGTITYLEVRFDVEKEVK
jgi:mannose-6-phosphate isomerase-like protein (cupin superfamily)